MINIDGNHAEFLFALKILIFFVIDGQDIEKLQFQYFAVRTITVLQAKLKD
jgi:hypothetical protein